MGLFISAVGDVVDTAVKIAAVVVVFVFVVVVVDDDGDCKGYKRGDKERDVGDLIFLP